MNVSKELQEALTQAIESNNHALFEQFIQELKDGVILNGDTFIKRLLNQKLNFNNNPEGLLTPLKFAVINHYNNTIDRLFKYGADVDTQDNSGFTALHLAIINCNVEGVRLLTTLGTDASIKDNNGWDAYDLANRCFYICQSNNQFEGLIPAYEEIQNNLEASSAFRYFAECLLLASE